ncbi:response regulator [bacterium]|nr:response regulator [bacterium]
MTAESTAGQSKLDENRSGKSRIMLVENHPVMRDTCRLLIDSNDHIEVCAAFATAEEALQQTPLLRPDLVLIDISLPGMSGIEFSMSVRAIAPDLPVLLMTGHGDERYRQEAADAGATGLVFKHEGPVALLSAIDEMLAIRT